MFIIIAGKANQGKTKTLSRLMANGKNKFKTIRMSSPYPFTTSLYDMMLKYIEEGYLEFFIDDIELFTWRESRMSSDRLRNIECLEGLEKLAEEFKLDIYVAMQISREGFL